MRHRLDHLPLTNYHLLLTSPKPYRLDQLEQAPCGQHAAAEGEGGQTAERSAERLLVGSSKQ